MGIDENDVRNVYTKKESNSYNIISTFILSVPIDMEDKRNIKALTSFQDVLIDNINYKQKEEKRKKKEEEEERIAQIPRVTVKLYFLDDIFKIAQSNYGDLIKSNKRLFKPILEKIFYTGLHINKSDVYTLFEIFGNVKLITNFYKTEEFDDKGREIVYTDDSQSIQVYKYFAQHINGEDISYTMFMVAYLEKFFSGTIYTFISTEKMKINIFAELFVLYWNKLVKSNEINKIELSKIFVRKETKFIFFTTEIDFQQIIEFKNRFSNQFKENGENLRYVLGDLKDYPTESYSTTAFSLYNFLSFFNAINIKIEQMIEYILRSAYPADEREKKLTSISDLNEEYTEYFQEKNSVKITYKKKANFFEFDDRESLLLKSLPGKDVKLGKQFLTWSELLSFSKNRIFQYSDDNFNFKSKFSFFFENLLRTYVLYNNFFSTEKYQLQKQGIQDFKELIMKI